MKTLKSTRESIPSRSGVIPVTAQWPWWDITAVAVVTLASFGVSAHYELNEALYALTRHWEHLQLDELPTGMLVLSICLIWLAWRRFRQAKSELDARQRVETRLASILKENRRLAQEHLRLQEFERKHLARELHDQLGQFLNAIKLDATSISQSGGLDAGFCVSASQAIVRSVDHVHGAVSDMIGRLRPVGLDELGLVAAIEHCLDHWRQRCPQTHFSLSLGGELDSLDEALTLTVYRLIQEGLTNIYKHAQATEARIQVERRYSSINNAEELLMTVIDNGSGMDIEMRTSRFGLSGMRERVELAGGRFALRSLPGEGLRLEAWLPVGGNLG